MRKSSLDFAINIRGRHFTVGTHIHNITITLHPTNIHFNMSNNNSQKQYTSYDASSISSSSISSEKERAQRQYDEPSQKKSKASRLVESKFSQTSKAFSRC